LQQRYGTLEAVNAAWGTDFWSEIFTDWSQIPAPRITPAAHNPSLLLAWKRFYSDAWTEYFTFQKHILQESGVTAPITTNMMGTFPHVDYHIHAQEHDIVLWDNYTEPGYPWRYRSALSADHMRSVRGGAPYWIAEQQSGCSGHDKVYGRTEPDRIRLMTYQAVAHGGDGILYFRWRTCRFGVEQYWHGILQHDGRPTWRYEEISRIAHDFRALPSDLFSARTPAKVALLWSHNQNWAHEAQPHVDGFSYENSLLPAYQALRDSGVDVDLVNEFSDLSAYRLLVAPAWQLIPESSVERIKAFVRGGGRVIFTYRSSVRDWENVIFADPLPGPLHDLLGITIDDYDAIGHFNADCGVQFRESAPFSGNVAGSLWADVITAENAEASEKTRNRF
jgi:beta-galactosidase